MASAFYCKRCGHNRDCHSYEKFACNGYTKRSGKCKCPSYVRSEADKATQIRHMSNLVRMGKL